MKGRGNDRTGDKLTTSEWTLNMFLLTTSDFSEKIPSCRLSSAIHLMGSRTGAS